MRYWVIRDNGEVLFDRTAHYDPHRRGAQLVEAGEEQSAVARSAIGAGSTVTILVTDPDDEERVLFRAIWLPD